MTNFAIIQSPEMSFFTSNFQFEAVKDSTKPGHANCARKITPSRACSSFYMAEAEMSCDDRLKLCCKLDFLEVNSKRNNCDFLFSLCSPSKTKVCPPLKEKLALSLLMVVRKSYLNSLVLHLTMNSGI